MGKRIITNEGDKRSLIDWLQSFQISEPLMVEIKKHSPKRSGQQNNKGHAWYAQIGKHQGLLTIEAKAECKLLHGVPIMRAESPEFCDGYDRLIKHRFTHEEKLELMQKFPVTSLMSKDQKARYMTAVQVYYANKGLILE